jgi:hypothetical protein
MSNGSDSTIHIGIAIGRFVLGVATTISRRNSNPSILNVSIVGMPATELSAETRLGDITKMIMLALKHCEIAIVTENKWLVFVKCLPRRKDKVNSISILGQQFLVESILNHSPRISQVFALRIGSIINTGLESESSNTIGLVDAPPGC